jgi:branched-chain amino acid transport system substrate-binding protein
LLTVILGCLLAAAIPNLVCAEGTTPASPEAIQPATPAAPVPAAQKAQVDSAKAMLEAGQVEDAINILQKFLEVYPQSPLVPDAYLLIGHALSGLRKWEDAAVYFRRFLDEYPKAPAVPEARLGLGTVLFKTGETEAAIPLLRQAKNEVSDPLFKLTILRRLEEAYLTKPDYPEAIDAALESRSLVPAEDVSVIEERVRMLLYSKTTEADLRRIAEHHRQTFPGDLAMLRLLEIYTATGDDHKVTRTAREFFKRFPRHEQIGTVSSFLNAQRQRLKAKDVLIGALLPLTGQLAPYGNQVLNGIKIALAQLADITRPSIGLVTKDSEDDPKQFTMELDDLLEDYHPVAVIGPLLTRNLKVIAPAADATDTVFFTPSSTYPDVQKIGRSLFSAAVNNRDLVRDLAAHAIVTLGLKRLCILSAQDSYGSEMAQFFSEEIQRMGAELIASDTYDGKGNDFGPSIKRIKAIDLKKYGKLEPGAKKGKQTKQYIPGFDAIFVPGDADKVGLIAGQLQFHGISTLILGTNSLDSPEFLRIGGRAVDGVLFADSFFVDSPNPTVRNFVDRYTARFNEPPTSFAAQAYEATLLIVDAILKGATTGRAVRESLKKVKDVPGLVGPLSMSPTGFLERRYVLIQVRGGKFMAMANPR